MWGQLIPNLFLRAFSEIVSWLAGWAIKWRKIFFYIQSPFLFIFFSLPQARANGSIYSSIEVHVVVDSSNLKIFILIRNWFPVFFSKLSVNFFAKFAQFRILNSQNPNAQLFNMIGILLYFFSDIETSNFKIAM